MRSLKLAAVLCVLALFIAGSAFAQQMPNPYGPNIGLDAAKKVAAAAAAKAKEMKINVVIAIVDTGGQLVYMERFDVVQWGSNDVAIHKAKASVMYKRATLALENAVKANVTVPDPGRHQRHRGRRAHHRKRQDHRRHRRLRRHRPPRTA